MPTAIFENIDLTQAERYILAIRIHPEHYSFSLHNPSDSAFCFHYPIKKSKQISAFRFFQDIYFDSANEFFTLPYRKVYIINYTSVFTYVPSLIFDDKDITTYLDFLFVENTGKLLHHSLQMQGITIVHTMPEEVYEFFQRSFIDAKIIHHTAPLIVYFQNRGQIINRNKIVVNLQDTELDILCFSRKTFLLGNHFHCNTLMDAVYYILFIWKQLNFNQLSDYAYIAGNPESKEGLIKELKIYIQNVIPSPVVPGKSSDQYENQIIPFEMACLSLCEL
jgi:hypothetical protein